MGGPSRRSAVGPGRGHAGRRRHHDGTHAASRASHREAQPTARHRCATASVQRPRTSLGTRLGRRRTVGLAQVDRADVEAVRSATSATFNDVILTLAGAVLRSHLEDRGELPSKPLVAFVPVSVRSDDKLDTGVNRLSGMLVSLATTVEDPVVRLMAVSECSRHAKAQDKVLGPDIFSSIAELALPSVLGPMGRLVLRAGVTTRWPPFNVTVSSFPVHRSLCIAPVGSCLPTTPSARSSTAPASTSRP